MGRMRDLLDLLLARVEAGEPTAIARPLPSPAGPTGGLLVGPDGLLAGGLSDPALLPAAAAAAAEALREGRTGVLRLQTAGGPVRLYVECHLPTPVLVVVGAGHVGQMVASVGAIAGFDVVVVDDRPEYANAARFPTAHAIRCGPFAAELADLRLGPRHYVVLMTRGHQQDRACLGKLLCAPVAYLGMIGSRNRIQTIFQLLNEEGVPAERLERVRAPLGLDIGARSPGEIAVAVVAELIATRRGGTHQPLSALGRSLVHAGRQ